MTAATTTTTTTTTATTTTVTTTGIQYFLLCLVSSAVMRSAAPSPVEHISQPKEPKSPHRAPWSADFSKNHFKAYLHPQTLQKY